MAKANKSTRQSQQALSVHAAVMTQSEAAAALRISISTLRYHIQQRRIRRVQIPGAKRSIGVVADDIRAILSPIPKDNGGAK